MADSVGFANLEKAFAKAKLASSSWYAKASGNSFEQDVDDLLANYNWPTTKNEAWKYTNLSKLALTDFALADAQIISVPEKWRDFSANDFDSILVFGAGKFLPELSKVSTSISKVASKLKSSSEIEKMNQLLLTDIASFEIKNKVEKPILALFLNSSGENQMSASRFRLTMAPFAEASLVEIHAGEDSRQVENHVCEIELKESAQLEHIFVNETPKERINFFTKKYRLGKASVLRSLHLDIGGQLTRTETYTELNDVAAEAFVNGLYLANAKQQFDHQGEIRHVARETTSHQLFKGILTGQSKATFNSKVRIEQTAPKANAEQLNKNLLLGAKAEVNSLPRLEIFNDDVKATHGSASGQIDREQLFYLVSRAISPAQALQLLVGGYAFEMLEGVNSKVAGKLQNLLAEKLGEFNEF